MPKITIYHNINVTFKHLGTVCVCGTLQTCVREGPRDAVHILIMEKLQYVFRKIPRILSLSLCLDSFF